MAKKPAYYRNKCDKLTQEWGRRTYDKCLVCPKPMNVLHHYFPKSVSSALRYDEENLIPLCKDCHFAHHSKSDPKVHNAINDIKGKAWRSRLLKKKEDYVKTNIGYYKGIIDSYRTN